MIDLLHSHQQACPIRSVEEMKPLEKNPHGRGEQKACFAERLKSFRKVYNVVGGGKCRQHLQRILEKGDGQERLPKALI